MKAKKALKRLTKVEALLTDVSDRYAASKGDLRAMLDDAKKSVGRAKKTVNVDANSKLTKKPPVKAAGAKGPVSAEARNGAPATKKRAATAA